MKLHQSISILILIITLSASPSEAQTLICGNGMGMTITLSDDNGASPAVLKPGQTVHIQFVAHVLPFYTGITQAHLRVEAPGVSFDQDITAMPSGGSFTTSLTALVTADNAGNFAMSGRMSGILDCTRRLQFVQADAQPIPVRSPDITGDGQVNSDDLIVVLESWGSIAPGDWRADVNGNHAVDVDDIVAVIRNFD